MKTRHFFTLPTVMLLVSLLPGWAFSADEPPPWYQVEIILFTYKDADLAREKWPDDPGTPDLKRFVEILEANELAPENGFTEQAMRLLTPEASSLIPRPYTVLNKEQLTLTREAQIIRRSSSRKLLMHMGWIQPALAKDVAPDIYVRTGKEYTLGKELFPRVQDTDSKPVTPPTDKTNTPPSVGIPGPDTGGQTTTQDATTTTALPGVDTYVIATTRELEGTIHVSISRYLHVKTDLLYHRPEVLVSKIDPTKTETSLKSYRFQDHRRMRSKELHYLDNPAFGLLIQITPFELPKADTRQP